MQWKKRYKSYEMEWRIKTRFAWFPVNTTLPDNKIMIWLENYQTNDVYLPDDWWRIEQIAPMGYWDKEGIPYE